MKATPDGLTWWVSSYSNSGTSCVEIARSGCAYVRDSKNRDGGMLTFEQASWTALIAAAKNGQ